MYLKNHLTLIDASTLTKEQALARKVCRQTGHQHHQSRWAQAGRGQHALHCTRSQVWHFVRFRVPWYITPHILVQLPPCVRPSVRRPNVGSHLVHRTALQRGSKASYGYAEYPTLFSGPLRVQVILHITLLSHSWRLPVCSFALIRSSDPVVRQLRFRYIPYPNVSVRRFRRPYVRTPYRTRFAVSSLVMMLSFCR